MKQINKVMAIVFVLSLLAIFSKICMASLCFAGSKTILTVSATVMPKVTQSVLHQERTIKITEGDISRGFVEIPSATILQVKTNSRNGYFLRFEGGTEQFKEVLVMDKGRTTTLSGNGGLVHQPYSGGRIEVKELSYRLYMRENTQPGLYAWPFQLAASLL